MRFHIPRILRNKYLIAFLAAMVWMLFFDNHNLVHQWKMHRQLRELQREKAYYLEEISIDSLAIRQLTTDPDALERYARENYLMKKEGEDVFIVIEDPR